MAISHHSDESVSSSKSSIEVDQVSSFGATKKSRLPALIKLQPLNVQQQDSSNNNKMDTTSSEGAKSPTADEQPIQASTSAGQPLMAQTEDNKENQLDSQAIDESDDFQLVDMDSAAPPMGPSLPPTKVDSLKSALTTTMNQPSMSHVQPPSQLGDSLIEMIINLRNENQNLLKALEANNEYVKERLAEFKRSSEDAKRKEAQFALDKADYEHQVSKLKRQNSTLSERLISMEAKLKDMKLEVSESLAAAASSKNSSLPSNPELYPNLGDLSTLQQTSSGGVGATVHMDATSGELYNNNDHSSSSSSTSDDEDGATGSGDAPQRLAARGREEIARRLGDKEKAEFYAIDDRLKQCDKLEQQLNELGKRDYEICLLQQQLNIYRQDYRLERMANLEAKLQIEKLKNDIDRLCYERLQASSQEAANERSANSADARGHHRVRFGPTADAVGKLGIHLGKKAAKQAAKAAKYAAKQAHLERKAAAATAAAVAGLNRVGAAASAAAARHEQSASATGNEPNAHDAHGSHHHHHHRGRHHHHGHGHHGHGHHGHGHHSAPEGSSAASGRPRPKGVGSEIVSDLMSTANKAMLTGYKMASTGVNLALDKLNEFEQAQAANLAKNSQSGGPASGFAGAKPSAPHMEPPSMD